MRLRFDDDFINSEARPFSAIETFQSKLIITGEVHAALEGLCELRSHGDIQVILILKALLARLHGRLDHPLEVRLVRGAEHVGQPLAVHVVPVPLVRQVPEDRRLAFGRLEHVLQGEPLDLLHGGDHHLLPLDVL